MNIVVCSGKGGTGKTTIATSLALSLAEAQHTWYMDCDVEAPNGHIFLHPVMTQKTDAVIQIPHIDSNTCTACGRCVEVCQFHALALVANKVMVFPQLCHGCGSCTWNCPEGAITEVPTPIGSLEYGVTKESIHFEHGMLTISEPMGTPIIRQLKKWKDTGKNAIVVRDSPPGASCPVVATLLGGDFALLVTEPTPFGLHDLKQIVGILEDLKIPAGIIVNRDGIGNDAVDQFAIEKKIPIMMRIPYDKSLAAGIASGRTLLDIMPEYRQKFLALFADISSVLNGGAA